MLSLLNIAAADEVAALVDRHGGDHYGPEVERALPRDRALGIIHAAIWAHACRSDSTAGAYANMALFESIGLKGWTFDEEEAEALARFRRERALKRRAEAGTPKADPSLLAHLGLPPDRDA